MQIERRKQIRRRVRIPCVLQFQNGVTIRGFTQDVSLSGVSVETNAMSGPRKLELAPGDSGLLTLKYTRGDVVDSILLQCRVVHAGPHGIGLSVRISELGRKDRERLGSLIASGEARI